MIGADNVDREGFSPIQYLGKQVKDEYNRAMGTVAGVTTYLPESDGSSGSPARYSLVVQTSSGFEEVDPVRVVVDGSTLVVRSQIKQELNEAKERIVWLFSRIKALEKSDGQQGSAQTDQDVPVLTAAQIQYRARFNEALDSVQPLLERTQRRIDRLHFEVETLERCFVELNVGRRLRQLDEHRFDYWSKVLREGLNSSNLELADLEEELKMLSRFVREYKDVFKVEIIRTGTEDS
ncbi:MAG: hypothetical protein M1357_02880 [Candidatus Marsarchaeota archaeon]|nr:hypothetical protein [Candidatus Marsarchaeota archaeon]